MTAPLITGPLAEHFGLAPIMAMGGVVFFIAAIVWRSLPETVVR